MNMFRDVIYAKTEKEATDFMEHTLSHELVRFNERVNKHLQHLWKRRPRRMVISISLLNRGHNTNNYCEASIRIFKDVVLQRCKAFNICALVDFVIKTFELYHKKRLINFANSRSRRMTLAYEKFCEKSKNIRDILKISDDVFHVKSEKKHEYYTIDCINATCSCPSGRSGRFCKHMCAIEKKYGVIFKTSLLLSDFDRKELAQLALGKNIPPSFFSKMTEQISIPNEVSSVLNEELGESYNPDIPFGNPQPSFFTKNIDPKAKTDYIDNVNKINEEFERITTVLKKEINEDNTNNIANFVRANTCANYDLHF